LFLFLELDAIDNTPCPQTDRFAFSRSGHHRGMVLVEYDANAVEKFSRGAAGTESGAINLARRIAPARGKARW
jgi:hypothetical protein